MPCKNESDTLCTCTEISLEHTEGCLEDPLIAACEYYSHQKARGNKITL